MASWIRLLVGSSLVSAIFAAPLSVCAERASSPSDKPTPNIGGSGAHESPRHLQDEFKVTQGSMTIGGHALGYQSEAGYWSCT